jgi:uncharacterized damage-inducible protein DinB
MSQLRQLQMLTRYRSWVDRLLFQALSQLSEAALTAPQPIVFGSLLRTLNHVHCMDQVWQAHLLGVPHGFTSRNPEDCPAFAPLRGAQQHIDDWYVRYAQTLSERDAEAVVRFRFIGGGPGEMSRGDILLHVVNHATYHRGHVAAMMYGLSLPPPTTDLPVFLRDEG